MYEAKLAQCIFYLEKELGSVWIDDEYPLIKMLFQLEQLQNHAELEKAEADKLKRR